MAKDSSITQYESFMLINQKAIDIYGGRVDFYIKKGYLRKYDSLKIFTEKMGISDYYDNLVKNGRFSLISFQLFGCFI